MILLDEDFNLRILVILRVAAGNLLRQFALGKTACLNIGVYKRHANHAVSFYAYGVAREIRAIQDVYVQYVARSDPVLIGR